MMKMKNTNKQSILKVLATIFAVLALVVSFSIPSVAQADYDYYDGAGYYDDYYDDYSYDYYDDYDDYSYDYYDDYDDYSYDYYDDYDDYSYDSYDDYYPSYSTPSYSPSYHPTYTPSYSSYTPAPYPVYVPTATQSQAQTNTGTNTNNNTSNSSSNSESNNTNTNNNNNVNNNVNNINIVVGTPVSGSTYNPPQQNNLDGNCYASPSNVGINQDVRFTANASGGNGNYAYSWTGTDGLSSGSQSFTGRYQNPGNKTATVTISSGSQSITRTCNVYVEGNVINNNYSNLTAYCVASPATANIGQTITWTVYASGGYNSTYGSGYGNYTYSWTGTDGLSYGNASAIQKTYGTAGTKNAVVTVYSNGQSISASCYANVIGAGTPVSNVTVIRQPTVGTPVSGVYLSQVPDTGIAFNLKVALFALGLLVWSAFIGYVLVMRKRGQFALANGTSASAATGSIHTRIQQFKLENMRKRGLIK